MWPFGRKKTPAPEAQPEPGGDQPAAPPDGCRTAEDILRQLEAESHAGGPPTGSVDPKIGQCLLAEGPITREFLDQQLAVAGRGDSYLGRLLGTVPAPTEEQLYRALAAGRQIPDIDLKQCRVHVPTARSIPPEVAIKYQVVPIDRIGDIVCIVFAGEPNPKAIDAVRRETGARVKALRCPKHHIQILLRRLYARRGAAAAEAVAAISISKQEHDAAAHTPAAKAEARWESVHASKGPIRAARLARR